MHPAAVDSDADLVRARRTVGDFELTICTDGSFLLDGGAMFGVVPKTLWSRRTPADEQNRVLLGTNCVVVRSGTAVVLIETRRDVEREGLRHREQAAGQAARPCWQSGAAPSLARSRERAI